MPNNQIKTTTFCNRYFGCGGFKEDKNYIYLIKSINRKVLREYKKSINSGIDFSFSESFTKHINRKSIRDDDIVVDNFDEWAIECSVILQKLYSSYTITNSPDCYVWRGRLVGEIMGQIQISDKIYNLDFSYNNTYNTFHELKNYAFNFFVYNKSKNKNHDGVVYCVNADKFYYIKYIPEAYTITRGFLSCNIKSRILKPGQHCLSCSVKGCKPFIIENERML